MVKSKVTSFTVGSGKNKRTIAVTMQDIGLSPEEAAKLYGDKKARAELTARIRSEIENDPDSKEAYASASLDRQQQRKAGKEKAPTTLREDDVPEFTEPSIKRQSDIFRKQIRSAKTMEQLEGVTESVNNWYESLWDKSEQVEGILSNKLARLGGKEADRFEAKIDKVIARFEKKQEKEVDRLYKAIERKEKKISG